jgi:hypothetical protein
MSVTLIPSEIAREIQQLHHEELHLLIVENKIDSHNNELSKPIASKIASELNRKHSYYSTWYIYKESKKPYSTSKFTS